MATRQGTTLRLVLAFLALAHGAQALETGTFLRAINAGGSAFCGAVAADGGSCAIPFEADNSFSGASSNSYVNPNGQTSSSPLTNEDFLARIIYNTHRFTTAPFALTYTIAVRQASTANIVVRLYFAEVFPPYRTPSARLFQAFVNGVQVGGTLDVFSLTDAGTRGIEFDIAIPATTSVVVTFGQQTGQPMISGVAVFESAETDPVSTVVKGRAQAVEGRWIVGEGTRRGCRAELTSETLTFDLPRRNR